MEKNVQTYDSSTKVDVTLPEKYYLDYFHTILDYVSDKYTHLLVETEAQFLFDFQNLPEDARCLYIRMIMRRGEFFRFNDLRYNEIHDLSQNLSHLVKAGFVDLIDKDSILSLSLLLSFLKKAALQILANRVGEKVPPKSARKKVFIDFLLNNSNNLIPFIAEEFTIYQQKKTATAEMVFFLYFGTLHRDISEFVVRDLGFRSFVDQGADKLTAYFKTRQEIDEKWQVSKLRIAFYERMEHAPPQGMTPKSCPEEEKPTTPKTVFNWLKEELESLNLETDTAQRVIERLRIQAAKWFEKEKHPAEALWLYQGASRPPAIERSIRIHEKLGNRETALSLSKDLLTNTVHAEEFFFARDFILRLESGKRTLKSTTKRLKKAKKIEVSLDFKQQVEMGALNHYTKQGYNGIFMENVCWRAFFGLLFWEVIFDDAQDAFHHPFQSVPSDWRTDLFYEKRKKAIHELLEKVTEENWLEQQLAYIFKEKYGLNNPLVYWYEELLTHLGTMLNCITKPQLQAILLKMAVNLQSNTKGFPDLFIYNATTYQFIEIKSPRDTLSAQQLYWIEFFEEIGVNVGVVKVEFKKE